MNAQFGDILFGDAVFANLDFGDVRPQSWIQICPARNNFLPIGRANSIFINAPLAVANWAIQSLEASAWANRQVAINAWNGVAPAVNLLVAIPRVASQWTPKEVAANYFNVDSIGTSGWSNKSPAETVWAAKQVASSDWKNINSRDIVLTKCSRRT